MQLRSPGPETDTKLLTGKEQVRPASDAAQFGEYLILRFREASELRDIPGVNKVNATIMEVCHIASCELGLSQLSDRGDLCIRVAYRSTERAAVSGDFGKKSCGITLETKDATSQIFCKHILRGTQQCLATLAVSQ